MPAVGMAIIKGGMKMGKFVIGETKSGGLKFNLKAGNGQVIAS